ncbi:MAG: hypothetical protein MNPFHGCM_02228 [Gemmatimonadaceae bacterium]|nr:hypothetical protein [Gemmatimonadaceae bacterium]
MPSRRTLLLLSAVAAVLLAAVVIARALHQPIDFEAPLPTIVEDIPDSIAPPAPSSVEAPILYDLGPGLASLENAVPRSFGNIDERLGSAHNSRLHYAFSASRSPFEVSFSDQTVRISTTIEYEGRGWYKPILGPEVSAACGTGNVARPRLRATLTSRVALAPTWELKTRTTIARLEPFGNTTRDRCRVTVFRFDVTERVISATRDVLNRQLATLDRNIAGLDTRARFESWWQKLQVPIRLRDSIFLTLNPKSAQLGTIAANERTVIANVRLTVQPQIVTGARPNDFALMTAIPPLAFGATEGSGMNILMEGVFTYPVATSLLGSALRGREVKQAGRRVVIRDVRLSGIGAGRVALGVDLSGDVTGRVYFTGRPHIDTLTRQVTVPDLEYDVGSSSLLVRGLDWLKGDDLRDLLRERARLPDSAAVGKLIPLAERGMNRQIAEGVVLRGRIDEARGLRVRATTHDVRVYAIAKGSARLTISRDLPAPRRDTTARAKRANPFRIPSEN